MEYKMSRITNWLVFWDCLIPIKVRSYPVLFAMPCVIAIKLHLILLLLQQDKYVPLMVGCCLFQYTPPLLSHAVTLVTHHVLRWIAINCGFRSTYAPNHTANNMSMNGPFLIIIVMIAIKSALFTSKLSFFCLKKKGKQWNIWQCVSL